jgi:hypothetical protein
MVSQKNDFYQNTDNIDIRRLNGTNPLKNIRGISEENKNTKVMIVPDEGWTYHFPLASNKKLVILLFLYIFLKICRDILLNLFTENRGTRPCITRLKFQDIQLLHT